MSELYIQKMVGFRVWKMRGATRGTPADEADTLYSIFAPVPWPTNEPVTAKHDEVLATAIKGDHQAPGENCLCGIWGFWDYSSLQRANLYYAGREVSLRGLALAWGRIWVHDLGFRAQYAEPIALLDWPDRRTIPGNEPAPEWNEAAERIAARYELPLLSETDLCAYAEMFQVGKPA